MFSIALSSQKANKRNISKNSPYISHPYNFLLSMKQSIWIKLCKRKVVCNWQLLICSRLIRIMKKKMWEEPTDNRLIPLTKASNTELCLYTSKRSWDIAVTNVFSSLQNKFYSHCEIKLYWQTLFTVVWCKTTIVYILNNRWATIPT